MPRSFRGYSILKPLGMGGMASIYLGVQENLRRQVAIKLLDKRLALSEDFVRRFEREARAASELNHRNIITIHEFGNEDEDFFIVMEYVDGVDLRGVLNTVGRVPAEVTLVMLDEIAQGLAAAHERDIVHRDIKPANILFSKTGDIKVTDFGLARDFGMDTSRLFDSLTTAGTVLGTPMYMSPEQASGQAVDGRTDIFSLGVMAYEMLCGERPFAGTTFSEIQAAVLETEPPPLQLDRTLGVPLLQDLLDRMLAKEPSRRPTAHQLVHQIESCMEALDPSGTLLRYRRRFLEKFAANPEGFAERLGNHEVKKNLDRGLYAKALGLEQLDQAMEHLEYVQRHDPENERARAAMEEIRDFGGGDATEAAASSSGMRSPSSAALDVTQVEAVAPEPASAARTPVPEEPKASSYRRPAAFWLLPVVGLLALAAAATQFAPEGMLPDLGELLGSRGDAEIVQAPVTPMPFAVDSSRVPTPDTLAVATVDLPTADEKPKSDPPAGKSKSGSSGDASNGGTDDVAAATPSPDPEPAKKPTGSNAGKPQSSSGKTKAGNDASSQGNDVPAGKPKPKPKPTPPAARDAWLALRTQPPGNFFLDGKLVEMNASRVVVRVEPERPSMLEVRHPEIFGSRAWSPRVAAGDTLDLGTYEVPTGTVRVSTRPFAPIGVLIDGRPTQKETPLAMEVASRSWLLTTDTEDWTVNRVVVIDRSGNDPPRELVPGANGHSGVRVDVDPGQDLKVVFHLDPAN